MQEETAGSLLAKVLRAQEEGVSQAEISDLQRRLESKTIEQLSEPSMRVTLATDLIGKCLRSDTED